jgi:glycosyltransferase involved in cell wall biosynthesis
MSKRNPKVLVVATSRKTRGGITSVVKAHEQGEQWEKFHCKWIETHIDKNYFYKLFYFFRAFVQFLFLLPFYDIVHIHLSEPLSAMRKCFFFIYSKLFEKKIIIHFHSFSIDTTIRSKFRNIYKYLFLKADYVIVLSEYWGKVLNDEFSLENNIITLYNPCTTCIFEKQYHKNKEILYAGTVNVRKGYADLIKAFAQITQQFPDWNLVFAGNGEIKQAKYLAKELNIEKQVIFLGWISGEKKDRAFKEAGIFCLPSYAEGFPMAILDAWTYGLPVISTPVGGVPDIAIDKKNILLFSPGNIAQLAEQLKKMINDTGLRESITRESLKLVDTVFNLETINGQLKKIYNSLCTQKD